MTLFEGTDNKHIVRQQWDLPIIQKWATQLNKPLAYFGLPGPYIKDLLCWRDYLGRCTGVERLRTLPKLHEEDLEAHRRLLKNIMINNIEGFQLLRGYLEDVILEGSDLDATKPSMSNGNHPLTASFHYDLINLDFLGGMGYKNRTGESKRVRALKKLFERQIRTSFLLVLTLNVRDGIGDEITHYLEGAVHEAESQKRLGHRDILQWYTMCDQGRKDYKLKALVPIFIRREAERWGFECFCYPPLTYIGDGSACMVHFVFNLTYTSTVLHAFSPQSESDVLDLAFIEVHDGKFRVLETQHPNFNFDGCYTQFSFLPEETRVTLLSTLSNG